MTQDGPNAPPTVLFATGREWLSGSRLILALRSFGCGIELLSSASHPARLTAAVDRWTPFRHHRPYRSLEAALEGSRATAIIVADEVMLKAVQPFADKPSAAGVRLRQLVETTAAPVAAMSTVATRLGLVRLASEKHLPMPETMNVPEESDIPGCVQRLGFPLVLKSDGSAGGQGVRLVRSEGEAVAAWKRLHRTPGLLRVLKRGFADGEWMHLRTWSRRETSGITAQRFVRGPERTAMAVAHEGRLLAFVAFEVVQTTQERGPSSVLRLIEDEQMRSAAKEAVRALGLSGFCGFDFIVDPVSQSSLMIEMNLRPTQISYLSFGPGNDLVAAFVREVLGVAHAQDRPAVSDSSTVALFPQELKRDPASRWLQEAYHDVPWEAPELVRFAAPGFLEKATSIKS